MILLFSDWVLSKSQGGLLGYQYDNLTRELVVQGDLPEGWAWDMLVSASGKGDTWPLALGDGQASITLTDDNLSVRGEYYLQLRGTNGDQVRHTNVITAYNSRSLSGAGQWPTLPTEWIQAEKDIKELNAHPPVPGSDGYWFLWDLSSHSYQESDLPVPVGPAGPPNVLEIGTVETLPADQQATASITGKSPAQKLNLGIPRGKQGATGNPGAPGKDGKNGVTPTLAAGNVETLEPGQPATASVTGDGPEYQINLGIPRGQTGAQGAPGQDGQDGQDGEDGQTPTITVGTVTTLAPGQDATAEITGETPNLTLNLGIPEGQPGQDGVQLNDNAVNTSEAWSSKKIVDTLCPEFSVSGNPVVCHPVEGYPLSAVVSLEPKQAGSGDPSPENVRPISGYDSVEVDVRGKNLFDVDSGFALNGSASVYGFAFDGEFFKEGVTYSFSTKNSTKPVQIKVSYTKYGNNYITGTIPVGGSLQATFHKFPNVPDPHIYIFLQTGGTSYGNGVDVVSIEEAKALNLQIEASSTPTPYEPYQPGTTATLTLPETIYGGTVDAVTGDGSKEWEFVEFDGTETWYITITNGTTTNFHTVANAEQLPETGTPSVTQICNVASWKPYNWSGDFPWTISGSQYAGNIYISVPIEIASTVEQWKSYLAAQASAGTPLQVVYKLATPEPFQATGNQALPAVAGLNTVYTDGDSLDVTGRQDLQSTIQTMQAQITALQDQATQGGTA